MYQATGDSPGAGDTGFEQAAAGAESPDDNVIDAEFEEN